jgi:hypothetical protein
MRIAFWTTYFPMEDSSRMLEIDTCLQINAENPTMDVLYILVEGDIPIPVENPKIVTIRIDKRPAFSTFFEFYKQYEGPDTINVLLNSDIVVDYKHTHLFDSVQKNMLFAITRYEIVSDHPSSMEELSKVRVELYNTVSNGTFYVNEEYASSQDVWAIRGYPLTIAPFTEKLGVPKCDGRVALHFLSMKYLIYNPCLSIYTYHFHRSKERNYPNKCPGDTLHIRPTNIAVVLSGKNNQSTVYCDEVWPPILTKPKAFSLSSMIKKKSLLL